MFPDLGEKCALVLGGSPLGGAVSEALREAGASVIASADMMAAELRDVDILITLPKAIVAQPLEKVSDDSLYGAIDSIVRPVLSSTREVLPNMRQRGWGRIIHVVWGQAVGAMRNVSVDAAAAAAVNQFARTIGIECARSGVTVNVIALGWFKEVGLSNLSAVERYIPLRRFGTGEDLGALLIYLASNQASYITAQTHLLDGGLRSRA